MGKGQISLLWLSVWSVSVVSLVAFASGGSDLTGLPIAEELVKEIESLEVIHQVNLGATSVSTVGLAGETSLSSGQPVHDQAGRAAATARRLAPRRPILSQPGF